MRISWEEEHLQQGISWDEEHLQQGASWDEEHLQQGPSEEHLQQGPTCQEEHLQQIKPILVADEPCSLHTDSWPTNTTNARHVTADATYYIHQRSDTTRGDSTSLDEAGVGFRG
jgi:hypothetical protein